LPVACAGVDMRFVAFRERNTDPSIPAIWITYPMALDEPAVCNVGEEYDRIEGLPLHWDDPVHEDEWGGWVW
jgi:hypothetical protein